MTATTEQVSQHAKDVFDEAVAEAEQGYDPAFLEAHTRAVGHPLQQASQCPGEMILRRDQRSTGASVSIFPRQSM